MPEPRRTACDTSIVTLKKVLTTWPLVLLIVLVIALATVALSEVFGTTVTVCSGLDELECREETNRNGVVFVAGLLSIVAVAVASRQAQRAGRSEA